jgi:hypothetical protein
VVSEQPDSDAGSVSDKSNVKDAHSSTRRKLGALVLSIAVLAVILIVIGLVFSVGFAPHASTSLQITSTSYQIDALAVISGTIQQNPGGYFASTSSALHASSLGAQSAAYAILGQAGSTANVTIIVFDQNSRAQTYFDSFKSNVQGLPGYSDISSAVSAYQRYGQCYGHGEDVDGIAVAVGICTKGNVFLEVHLTSSNDFATAQGDLTTLMAASYNSVY